jgi:hypothetical protein
MYVYLYYRRKYPETKTMKNEITELQENDIDVSPLVEYKDDHCPPAELSKE